MRRKTFLAKRSMSIDLEYGMLRIEEGKTYTDDGTTIFDAYVSDDNFEAARPGLDTILVSHPESRKGPR